MSWEDVDRDWAVLSEPPRCGDGGIQRGARVVLWHAADDGGRRAGARPYPYWYLASVQGRHKGHADMYVVEALEPVMVEGEARRSMAVRLRAGDMCPDHRDARRATAPWWPVTPRMTAGRVIGKPVREWETAVSSDACMLCTAPVEPGDGGRRCGRPGCFAVTCGRCVRGRCGATCSACSAEEEPVDPRIPWPEEERTVSHLARGARGAACVLLLGVGGGAVADVRRAFGDRTLVVAVDSRTDSKPPSPPSLFGRARSAAYLRHPAGVVSTAPPGADAAWVVWPAPWAGCTRTHVYPAEEWRRLVETCMARDGQPKLAAVTLFAVAKHAHRTWEDMRRAAAAAGWRAVLLEWTSKRRSATFVLELRPDERELLPPPCGAEEDEEDEEETSDEVTVGEAAAVPPTFPGARLSRSVAEVAGGEVFRMLPPSGKISLNANGEAALTAALAARRLELVPRHRSTWDAALEYRWDAAGGEHFMLNGEDVARVSLAGVAAARGEMDLAANLRSCRKHPLVYFRARLAPSLFVDCKWLLHLGAHLGAF